MSVDIGRLTAHLPPQQQASVKRAYRERAESGTTAFLLCFFVGLLGIHRFYLRQWQQGLLHLLVAVAAAVTIIGGALLHLSTVLVAIVGGLLLLFAIVWVIIDLVRIDEEVDARNLAQAETLIAQAMLGDHTVERAAEITLDTVLRETQREAGSAATLGRMQMMAGGEATAAGVAVGVATATYASTTVTQVSEDIGAPRHPAAEAASTGHGVTTTEQSSVTDGADAGAPYQQTITESLSESPYSVTASVETLRSSTFPAFAGADETFATEPLPTPTESEAGTWPDHPQVTTDAAGQWMAPDVTDRGVVGAAQPIADVAFGSGVPVQVVLPSTEPAAGAVAASGESTLVARPASEPPAAPADGLLYLVPDVAAPSSTQRYEVPAAAYVPPTVPVVSAPVVPPASHDAPTYSPWSPAEPAEPATQPLPATARSEPHTLGDLTDLAALGSLGALAASQASQLVAASPAAHTPEPTAPVNYEAESHGVSWSAPDTGAPTEDPALAPHHQLKRVRVVRQVKVDGKVTSETVAEAYIDPDADPEPVKAQLREQLRQQAEASQA